MSVFAELNPPYSTIVADPPWPAAHKLTGVTRVGRVKKERGIEVHYSTMTLAEIAALPVAGLADPGGCHLYLWTTNLNLEEAFDVLRSWGFAYKTTLTWIKTGHLGLGRYFRTQTEHILFGVRGSLPTQSRTQVNYFTGSKKGHSIKPAAGFELIQTCSPGPYVELFARAPQLGWDSWGKGVEASVA